ncbi:MAG TPA: hypothetical protein VFS50_11465 [Meiothermus sp.]|nr:hypothetical protein [Meiothermus sp.]
MEPRELELLPSPLTFADHRVQSMIETVYQLGITHPLQLEPALTNLGLAPRLINPPFATTVCTPLGKMLHIPVQISTKAEGRLSLYFLPVGEETLAGYLINSQGEIYERRVKRETGSTIPAQTGDEFRVQLRTLKGEVLWDGVGRLQIIDSKRGEGRLEGIGNNPKPFGCYWAGWSFVMVCD